MATNLGDLFSIPKAPKQDDFSAFGIGPRSLNLHRRPTRRTGPGEPPPGFVTPTTSAEEWVAYWAMARVFEDPAPDKLRTPPYFGGLDWGYQLGDRELGSAVVDFVAYLPGEIIGIRLVTEFFHAAAGVSKQATDESQLLSLARWMTVRDLYAQDIIEDASGESAVRAIVELLGGRERLPVAVRFRRARLYQK